MSHCMACWEAILPETVAHPSIHIDLKAILACFQDRFPGAMYSGCGGGYLVVASEEPGARLLAGQSQNRLTHMLKTGILNPAINSLISRVRHTNTLVIADRGFPYWPRLETVDIALVDDVPRVLDVLRAIGANFVIGRVFMAEEFLAANGGKPGRSWSRRFPGSR